MKYIIFTLTVLTLVLTNDPSNAQSSLTNYLDAVKMNNKSLQSANNYTEAVKMAAKTGLTPNNPEFEFGYFPGNTDAIGTKQVLGISQSLDFPSTYIYKNKISGKSQQIADLELQKIQQQTLLNASKVWSSVVYLNKLAKNYSKRTADALQMVSFYLKKQENGDATQLEVNKAKLFLLSVQNKNRLNQSYLKNNNELLKQFNGGREYTVNDTVFYSVPLKEWSAIKTEIDSLLPELKQFVIENQMAELNLKLNNSAWLPNLMLGYESEEILGDTYSGLKAGLSIPLWENKNTIKKAKADIVFIQSQAESAHIELYGEFHSLYIEAEALQNNLKEFEANLSDMNNEYLLSRSLELGQISAIEYFIELDYFYNIIDDLLELESLYQLSLVELYRYKL
jgi:outer membrane protein TolC